MKIVIAAIVVLAMASPAGGTGLTKDGQTGPGGYGYNYIAGDRTWLATDGSFERGCDEFWSCSADNGCTWIADLVPLGLWNYDGGMVAWLGGFCGGYATCHSEICQTVGEVGGYIFWWWMAYVNDSVGVNYVSVDGHVVYSHVLQPSEHLAGYQQAYVYTPYYGRHEICFGVDNSAGCGSNQGDNWFVDYVELGGIIDDPGDTGVPAAPAWESLSISTVKAQY